MWKKFKTWCKKHRDFIRAFGIGAATAGGMGIAILAYQRRKNSGASGVASPSLAITTRRPGNDRVAESIYQSLRETAEQLNTDVQRIREAGDGIEGVTTAEKSLAGQLEGLNREFGRILYPNSDSHADSPGHTDGY